MSTPIVGGVNTSETVDETQSLNGREPKDVNSAASNLSSPVTSKEVARQIKAADDPLTKQLERLCDLMKEFQLVPLKRFEETTGFVQGPLRAHSSRFDICTATN